MHTEQQKAQIEQLARECEYSAQRDDGNSRRPSVPDRTGWRPMNAQQTQPWRVERSRTPDGDTMVCVLEGSETIWQAYACPRNEERAQRIADCVNVCAAISKNELSHGPVIALHRFSSVVNQREEALAALELMLKAQSARRHPLGAPDEGIATLCAEAASKAEKVIAGMRS